jgi:hypothetical protein
LQVHAESKSLEIKNFIPSFISLLSKHFVDDVNV